MCFGQQQKQQQRNKSFLEPGIEPGNTRTAAVTTESTEDKD